MTAALSLRTKEGSPSTWWDGQTYQKGHLAQFTLANDLLKQFPFRGQEKVLDLGWGDGAITALIAKEKVPQGRVFGVDVSESMVKTANATHSDCSNVNFLQGDAQDIQLHQTFDLIVSFSALHWATDQEAVWNGIRGHLNVGGKALISLNPLPRQKELTDTISTMMKKDAWCQIFEGFKESPTMPELDLDDYKDIVLSTGLAVNRAVNLWDHFEFDHAQALRDNLLGWLPHLKVIPEVLKVTFIQEFVDHFLAFTRQSQSGPIRLHFNRFIIEAERVS